MSRKSLSCNTTFTGGAWGLLNSSMRNIAKQLPPEPKKEKVEKKRQGAIKYSDEQIIAAIKDALQGKMKYREVANKHDINYLYFIKVMEGAVRANLMTDVEMGRV